MNFDTIHPLQPCWDVVLASVKADALDTALHLGVFEALRSPATADSLAQCLRLEPGNTRHLLDLLWSMGIVTRRPVGEKDRQRCEYALAPALAPFLLSGSDSYCGDALRYRLHALRQFGAQLSALLRTGASLETSPDAAGWAQAAEVQIAQEQGAATIDAALACVRRLEGLSGGRRFLDLGGGPGKVAVALAQHFPEWQGVVFDLPATAAVAQQSIRRAGLEHRLESRGGDILHDGIGEGYDLIWCSSVLHFLPEVPKMLGKIRDALAPGGYFVSVHAELPSKQAAAARVMPYYLPLMMRGRQVWPHGALADLMRELGFESVSCDDLSYFPLAPAQVVIGRRGRS
ncbi:methyltransferase [Pseudogulbenkiania sp. MAI-1]|uniref:methyltransferase n=1 Tax=Pseudogulbenkiania sp. MAI-1 TaxID=990370 RepID=UPI00045EC6C6|nr:methyltransferase [Pseudogulbenkiania sp. MAI-1]